MVIKVQLILWIPYYFGKIGLAEYSALISTIYIASTTFAVLFFNFISKRVAMSEETLNCYFLSVSVAILGGLCLVPDERESMAIYMGLLALLAFSQGGPNNFNVTTEIRKRAPGR